MHADVAVPHADVAVPAGEDNTCKAKMSPVANEGMKYIPGPFFVYIFTCKCVSNACLNVFP